MHVIGHVILQQYSTRAYLAEVIAILGPPPLTLISRGTRSLEFFTEDGMSSTNILPRELILFVYACGLCHYPIGYWKNDIEIPKGVTLHNSEEFLSGRNKEMFLEFMKGMGCFNGNQKLEKRLRNYCRILG